MSKGEDVTSDARALFALPSRAPRVRFTAPDVDPDAYCENDRPVILVGSRRDCQLSLNQPSVSKLHCAVVNDGSSIVIRDLCSRSGTFVNDRPVRVAVLRPGDTLRVGTVPVETTLVQASSAATRSADPTQLAQPLVLAFGRRRIELTTTASVIGRRANCDVLLDTPDVSLTHALIFVIDGCPAVCDLGSRSGTFLNGERTALAWLRDGDRINIGGEEAAVDWKGPTGSGGDHPTPDDHRLKQRLRAGEPDHHAAELLALADHLAQERTETERERERLTAERAELDARCAAHERAAGELSKRLAECAARERALEVRQRELARREATLVEREAAHAQTARKIERFKSALHRTQEVFTTLEGDSDEVQAAAAPEAEELPAPMVDRPLFVPPNGTPPEQWPPELRERLQVLRRVSDLSDEELAGQVLAEFRTKERPPPPAPSAAQDPRPKREWGS